MARSAPQPHDLNRARLVVTRELGPETIRRLHRTRPVLDWAVLVALPAIFLLKARFLALRAAEGRDALRLGAEGDAGVRERRSFLSLMWGFFFAGRPHRALWT